MFPSSSGSISPDSEGSKPGQFAIARISEVRGSMTIAVAPSG